MCSRKGLDARDGCLFFLRLTPSKHLKKKLAKVTFANFDVDSKMQSDEARTVASEIWLGLLSSNRGNNEESMSSLKEYLSLLLISAKGVSCRLPRGIDSKRTRTVWLTRSMRDDFERFGRHLCIGTCKRKTNALLWPYLAASLINELGNACLACEAIILREQIEAHRFVLDFIFDVCLRRARDNVSILSCDGFLSRKMWKTNFI